MRRHHGNSHLGCQEVKKEYDLIFAKRQSASLRLMDNERVR